MEQKKKSPFIKEMENFLQPEARAYRLPDLAKDTLRRCQKNKDNDKFCKKLLNDFNNECQWAESWFQDEVANNKAITPEIRDQFLKDFGEFTVDIMKWLKKATRKSKADFIQFLTLERKRDSLFNRSASYYQASIDKAKKDTARFKAERIKLEKEIERKKKAERKQLQAAAEKAYQSYNHAVDKNPDLVGKTDRDAYNWLKGNGCEDYEDYGLPCLNTWTRQLRTARNYYGTNKNTPRAGRKSNASSVKNDPDLLSQISNKYTKPD